jgi:translation initiation factor 2 alpha subunit (eIF-2alpha)
MAERKLKWREAGNIVIATINAVTDFDVYAFRREK